MADSSESFKSTIVVGSHFCQVLICRGENGRALGAILPSLKKNDIPDTVGYLTEAELLACSKTWKRSATMATPSMALRAPPSLIEYCHFVWVRR